MQRALVPEDLLHNGQRERRSFIRAVTAVALATKHNMRPDTLLAKTWPDDSVAPRVLRAAQSPTSSGGFPAMQAVRVLPMLAPAAASMRLLGLAHVGRSCRGYDGFNSVYRRERKAAAAAVCR